MLSREVGVWWRLRRSPGGQSRRPQASSLARTSRGAHGALPSAPELCLLNSPESWNPEAPAWGDGSDPCPLGHSNSPLPSPPLNSIKGTLCWTHIFIFLPRI